MSNLHVSRIQEIRSQDYSATQMTREYNETNVLVLSSPPLQIMCF